MPDTSTDRPDLRAFTVLEVAERLSVGRSTVYGLISEGQLAALRIGKTLRIPARSLAAFMSARGDDAK